MAQQPYKIEVIYALPMEQISLFIETTTDITVQEAIERSGILQKYSEIDLAKNKVGLFSKIVSLDQICQPGDRIEIYRDLLFDPREIRRRRMA